MWEMLAEERALSVKQKQNCQLQYYILAEEVGVAEGILCESYGIRIVLSNLEEIQSESLKNITFRAAAIDQLVHKMAEHLVTPAALRDVVEDWIAAG